MNASAPNRSTGRVTDGFDTDSNCNDFMVQTSNVMSVASAAGANNIKVTSVDGFGPGQRIIIDAGDNSETAVIASVGTAGGATMAMSADAGTTVLTVDDVQGFNPGQTIIIGSGADRETAVVASVSRGRRGRGGFGGFGGGQNGQDVQGPTITVASPLTKTHAEGTQVAGTGITLTRTLARAHDGGAQIASGIPTPGAPNQYYRRTQ